MDSDQEMNKSKEIVEKLLGSWIICTLADGRTTEGKFACIDRLNNIVLTDCTERRHLSSIDYNEYHGPGVNDKPLVKREVTRRLRQAMVPGEHVVKVEIDQNVYNEKLREVIP